MTIIQLVLLYLFLGVIVTALRPTTRSLIAEGFRREKGVRLVALCIASFVAVALWPIIWITNVRAASSEKKILADIKKHLARKGRNIPESDEGLWTYYRFILDRINKAAKERGERLPQSTIKDVSLEYMNLWLQAIEEKLGFGFFLVLNQGLEIYRAEGIQALLQFLREEQPLEQTQEPAAQSLPPHKKQPNLFGGGTGDSFETAVVINANNSFVGVEAEYAYIASQCGQPYKDWKLQSQGLCDRVGKPYDVLTIALSGGATRTFYFNITKFFTR